MEPAAPTARVLVVGAGPTGLMLALELARRGVPCRIVDRITTRSNKSRALVLHPRSMELLRLAGVDEGFRDAQRSTQVEAFVLGFKVGSLRLADYGADDTRFPYITFVSQYDTERILEGRLAELGYTVEYGVELAKLAQDDLSVTATLRTPGGSEDARFDYVVGCDGAHSAVRRELGLPFEGAAYPQTFLLADVHVDWRRDHDKLRVFLGLRGVMAFFPLEGARVSRLILMRPPVQNEAEGAGDPTLAEVQKYARFYTRRRVRLDNPVWLSRFRLHHRGVPRYRVGRTFVAGDAAHIHSPVGGQGMNTGIQDAANLGWKLAWILQRRPAAATTETLLSSYDAERQPIGQRLLATTDRLFQVAASGNFVVATLRNVGLPIALTVLSLSTHLRFRAFRFISQLGIRYRRSPLNCSARDEAVRAKKPQAGDRAPDLQLGDDRWLYDSFAHGGMSVLAIAASAGDEAELAATVSAARETCPWPVTITAAPAAARRYGVRDRAVLVIRPDAYVLMRADGDAATPQALESCYKRL